MTDNLRNEGSFALLFGYGPGNYTFTGKRGEIMDHDSKDMAQNNFTNSNSSFLTIFGRSGLLGLMLRICFILIMYKAIASLKLNTVIGRAFSVSGKVMILASTLFMFLYNGISTTNLAFVFIVIFISSVQLYEREAEQRIYL